MPIDPLIFAVTDTSLDSLEIEVLNRDLLGEMGADRFLGPKENEPLEVISKDEYPMLPDSVPRAKVVVQAHPMTPYYGPGYTRGDWSEIAAILEYLRHRVEGGSVWYGSDLADEVEEVTSEWLADMWRYWAINGCRSYFSSRRPGSPQ